MEVTSCLPEFPLCMVFKMSRHRGLIRGSSLSYRSRFTSCNAKDPAYDSEEFDYDYSVDSKLSSSRVNPSLQPDDDAERHNTKLSTIVTSESVTHSGGFFPTETRVATSVTKFPGVNLMDGPPAPSKPIQVVKPTNYVIGEPGEKRRKEEQTKFYARKNQALPKNTVTSQGIINYALATSHSRDSSYDNNNNSNNNESEEKMSSTTRNPPITVPTLPSPMSDGIPDFGTIVDTVTAVRKKVSPQGSTSGISSSSSSKSSTLAKNEKTPDGFNENDEWAQIANVMKSVGSSLNKGSAYAEEFEETFWRIMTGADLPRTIRAWLSDLNLSQYEEVLCGNGFDNVNFLASNILEEQDLLDMNIMNDSHRKRLLDSAKNLPKTRTLDLSPTSGQSTDKKTRPSSVSEWLRSLALEELEETFKMMGILTLERAKKMKDTEIAALVSLRGHRKRIRVSLGHNGQQRTSINRSTSQPSARTSSGSRSRLKSSPPLPRSPLLDKVNFFKDYSQKNFGNTVKSNASAPTSGGYSTGTASSSSSALTNYSSLSDQVVPVAILEEGGISDSRTKPTTNSRHHKTQFSSTLNSHHQRQPRDTSLDSNLVNPQDEFLSNFPIEEQDSLSLVISRLTESNPDNSKTLDYNKENIMATDQNEIRVPDARRASYLSSTGGELVLRPPNETTDEVDVSSWCHDPENLIKSCCNYQAYYLGSMLVHEVKGVESTVEACAKMKKSTDSMKKIPTVTLSISYRGVKFIDSKSKHEIAEHEIHNISFASQDAEDLSTLAYITRDARTGNHYCHVFRVTTLDVAYEIILTLGQAFEVAYQLILKEKAIQDGTA